MLKRLTLFWYFLSLTLQIFGQSSDRKFPRGIFFRNSFYSNSQWNNYNPNPVEMGVDGGVFLFIPVDYTKDSLHLMQLKYRPKLWQIKNLRIDLGLSPSKGGTFYISPTQPFHLSATTVDLAITVPLYFNLSRNLNVFFASGFNGSYYLSSKTLLQNGTQPPEVVIEKTNLGILIEFGFFVGSIDNPILIISNRLLEQLTAKYKLREFAITLSIPIAKKFGRVK